MKSKRNMVSQMKETLFSYPEYAEVNGKKYKINTDYRVAIRCNEISMQDIDTAEKGMAIIYLLFGEDALKDVQNYKQLVEKAFYYLRCGDMEEKEEKEPDMDFIQDFPYIVTSFKTDYNGLDITKEHIHWWDFYYMLTGLSQSEFGNSCILNRIRDLRNTDLSKITDPNEREKVRKAKEQFALKKNKKQREFTEEELKNIEEYHKLVGE